MYMVYTGVMYTASRGEVGSWKWNEEDATGDRGEAMYNIDW